VSAGGLGRQTDEISGVRQLHVSNHKSAFTRPAAFHVHLKSRVQILSALAAVIDGDVLWAAVMGIVVPEWSLLLVGRT